MKITKLIVLIASLFVFVACGEQDTGKQPSDSSSRPANETALKNNEKWPYAIIASFEVTDSGGYEGESNYPTWAVGFLDTGNPNEEITFELNGDALVKAKIDIDSPQKFKVWLNPAENEGDGYVIAKVEKLHE